MQTVLVITVPQFALAVVATLNRSLWRAAHPTTLNPALAELSPPTVMVPLVRMLPRKQSAPGTVKVICALPDASVVPLSATVQPRGFRVPKVSVPVTGALTCAGATITSCAGQPPCSGVGFVPSCTVRPLSGGEPPNGGHVGSACVGAGVGVGISPAVCVGDGLGVSAGVGDGVGNCSGAP